MDRTCTEVREKTHPGGWLWATLIGLLMWAMFVGLIIWTCGGCASMKDKSVADQQATLRMWTEFAQQNNITMIAQADYTGRGGLYQQSMWGIDLGVAAHATFIYQPSMIPANKVAP